MPRPRDPGLRRTEITSAAMEVIIEHGLAKASHRQIAERAGVALGSTTYYYPSLQDLLVQTLTEAVEQWTTEIENLIATRGPTESVEDVLIDAVASFIADSSIALVSAELYVGGARSDQLGALARSWLERFRGAIATVTDPVTARAIAALLDGAALQSVVLKQPLDREAVGLAMKKLLAP